MANIRTTLAALAIAALASCDAFLPNAALTFGAPGLAISEYGYVFGDQTRAGPRYLTLDITAKPTNGAQCEPIYNEPGNVKVRGNLDNNLDNNLEHKIYLGKSGKLYAVTFTLDGPETARGYYQLGSYQVADGGAPAPKAKVTVQWDAGVTLGHGGFGGPRVATCYSFALLDKLPGEVTPAPELLSGPARNIPSAAP